MENPDFVLAARTSSAQRAATLLAVLIPFVGVIAAATWAWGWGFGWVELVSLLVMYLATGLGITVGYHRLFTHRAFETYRPIKVILAILGSMTLQGPLLKWVAIHRLHHQHSDESEDPHSPHHYGGGVRGVLAGAWHAHLGWMFTSDHPDLSRYVRDLRADPLLVNVSRLFGVWVVIGTLIPAAAGGALSGTWTGAMLGFIWGGLVRIFIVQHLTFSINSVCHLWGYRSFDERDQSRNNFMFGVLALGEGWHNNHHAFPRSARHGLRWWEPDLSYLVIQLLQRLGLAWHAKLPAPHVIAAKQAPRRRTVQRDDGGPASGDRLTV